MERAFAVDDAELIRGTLDGRREDFDALVERYQKALYAFAYRFVHDHDQAADIVQVTFVQAYTHLKQFAGRSSFKTWLHQIALNECRALHRTAAARQHLSLSDMSERALEPLVAPDADTIGWKPLLERLITKLPLRQRAVVILRVFSDLPFKEIAWLEGISENSAKVSYHHAIARLRSWVREKDG